MEKSFDLQEVKERGELLKKRLEPILDVLIIANMKIEVLEHAEIEPDLTLYLTRNKMYETALQILKTEKKP